MIIIGLGLVQMTVLARIIDNHQFGLLTVSLVIIALADIGEKQGLENVIEAADRLRDEPLIFAIVGQGGGKARLEKWRNSVVCATCNFSAAIV